MRIYHRIAPINNVPYLRALAGVGIEIDPRKGFVNVYEDESRWQAVERVLAEFELISKASAEFTEDERLHAKYLYTGADWRFDYPQPEDGYMSITYDDASMCPNCHKEWVQRAPYQTKREPSWGRRSFFSFNWAFGSIFVKTEVYEQVFRPFGVDFLPLYLYRQETVVEGVVQLMPTESVHVDPSGLISEICPLCGKPTYNHPTRTFWPKVLNAHGPVVESIEWFGSGASANHLFLISQDIYRQIKDLRGLYFKPCAD